MRLSFAKWQGTGNDFIMIDDRDGRFPDRDTALVRRLCDRRFGVGSDGLVLVRPPVGEGADFTMVFINPDGSRSFCGNGSRCAFAFWSGLMGGREHGTFDAIDGLHHAEWAGEEVAVTLRDTDAVQAGDGPGTDFVHTGSPHELVHVEDPALVDVRAEGARRRHAPRHAPGGTNVNFVRAVDGAVSMRTYERGVEDETLSCGTGVVAAALSAMHRGLARSPVPVRTPGGHLRVQARAVPGGFTDVRLIGPVGEVFQGSLTIAE
ncbi:MAG: diaminopimelate epimerase [Flavobacteriales bacterium]|jgi:diaminopimelate epimerase|nr:diaminopimelate epimerase [Flavobacteriales bacterium]